MRYDFGKVYQEIRKSKNLTQSDVCGNVLSPTTLSKIENGLVVPKYENMAFLLQQINMSFDEFDYICNLYHPSEHTQLLNQISNIHSISGAGELETIYKKCESYLKTHCDISIQKLHQSLTVILQIRKNGISNRDKVTQDIVDILWNDLKHHDTWYASDFNILNSILFVLPTETILDTTQLVLHRLEKYSDFQNILPIKLALLSNLSTFYFYYKHFPMCSHICSIVIKTAKLLKRYDAIAFHSARIGICDADEELIQKNLEILRLLEEDELLKIIENEIAAFHATKASNEMDMPWML